MRIAVLASLAQWEVFFAEMEKLHALHPVFSVMESWIAPNLTLVYVFFKFSCLHEVKLLHSLLKCPVTVIVKFY